MFGRKKHSRRSTNIVFVLFRTILSLVMFVILLGGLYSAYKHFSGFDPLKLDPQTLVLSLIKSRSPEDILSIFSSLKLSQKQPDSNILGNLKIDSSQPQTQTQPESNQSVKTFVFSFAMLADSHSDNLYLKKALDQIKKDYPTVKFLIGLGDYTEVGTLDELKLVKKEFDSFGIRYFLIPGDHDLWDARDKGNDPTTNYRQVFGLTYQSFSEGNFYFILINNSDNYLGLGENQLTWLGRELEKANQSAGIYVFAHEPLYHPSSDRVMGKVESKLKEEAEKLTEMLSGSGVNQVFFGDIHFFSEYED